MSAPTVTLEITVLDASQIALSPAMLFTGTYEDATVANVSVTNSTGVTLPTGTTFSYTGDVGTNTGVTLQASLEADVPTTESASVPLKATGTFTSAVAAQSLDMQVTMQPPV